MRVLAEGREGLARAAPCLRRAGGNGVVDGMVQLRHRRALEQQVRLVRVAMELQGELDAQEDHDRWTLQLHLLLECAAMP